MRMIRATLKFYRRSATSSSHIMREARNEEVSPRHVYHEFVETWERPWGDELGKHMRRVSQVSTGKQFKFIDRVTPEYLQDSPKEQRFTDKCTVLIMPEDFTYLRLTEI